MLGLNLLCLKRRRKTWSPPSSRNQPPAPPRSKSHSVARTQSPGRPMAPTPPLPVTEDTPPDMLAGSMDLQVVLPSGRAVKMSVQRGTPMMDLLVQVATANKIPPGGHVIQAVGERGLLPYKPSTPIGALDTWTIEIVPKSRTTSSAGSKKGSSNNQQPFIQTFRLQVHLPRNQLFVTRVSPKILLSDVLALACSEKNLDPSKYELRHPANLEERLRSDWTLADYKLQEVTMVAKRGRPLGAGLSSSDIMALQKEEEKRRQQTRAGGSTGSAVLGLMFNKHSQSSVGDGSVSSDSLGGRSISPVQSDETPSPPGSCMPPPSSSIPPPRPARKRRPAPKPPGPPAAVISHSRNSSDSSGYHEASVLSESPESNGLSTSPSGTLPRRSKLTSAAPAPPPATSLSRSLSNLATVNGGGSRSVSHSVSTSSLASSGPGKKKKAAPPPPPIARPHSHEPVQPQRTLSLSTLSSQSSVDNCDDAIDMKRLEEIVKPPPSDFTRQTSVDSCTIKSYPERQIVEPKPEKTEPKSLPVLPAVELENVNKEHQPPVIAAVETPHEVVPGLQLDTDEIDKAFRSVTDELEAAILADELKQSSPLPEPPGSRSPSLSDWEYQLPAPPTAFQDRESPTPTMGGTIALGETAVFAENLDPDQTRIKNDINERLNQARNIEANGRLEGSILEQKESPRSSASKTERIDERLLENIAQQRTSPRSSVSKPEKIDDDLEENIVNQKTSPRSSFSKLEEMNGRLEDGIVPQKTSESSSISKQEKLNERLEENDVQRKPSPRSSISKPEKINGRVEESMVKQRISPRSSVSKPENIQVNERLEETINVSQPEKVNERLGGEVQERTSQLSSASNPEDEDDDWRPQQIRVYAESEVGRRNSHTEVVRSNQLKNFTITTYQRPRDMDAIFSEERKNLSELKKPLEATFSKHPLASSTSLPRTSSFSTGSSESAEHRTVRRSTSHISLVTSAAYKEAKMDSGHGRLHKTSSEVAASQGPEELGSHPTAQEPLQSVQVMRSILNPSGQETVKSEASIEQDSRRVDSESQSKQKETPQPILKTDSEPERKTLETAVKTSTSQTESEVKRYSYSGPPAVNFSTWSERPKSQVSIKLDSDYRIGTGQGGNQEHQPVDDAPKPTTKVEPVPLSLRIVTSGNTKRSPSFSSQKQTDEKQSFKEPHQVIVRTSSYNTAQIVDPSRIPIVRAVELKKSFLQGQQQNVQLGWNGAEDQSKRNDDKEEPETFKGVNNLAKRFSFAAPTTDNVRVGFRGSSARPVSAYLYGGVSDTVEPSDLKRNSTSTGVLNTVGITEPVVGNTNLNGAKKYTSVVGINGAGISTPSLRESDVHRSHPKITNSASVKVNGFALPKQPMPVVKGFRLASNGNNHSDSSLVTVSSSKPSEALTVKVQRSDSYINQNQRNLAAEPQPTFNVRIQHTPVSRVDSAPVKPTTIPVPPPAPLVAKKPTAARPKSFAATEPSPREQLMDAIRSFGGRNSLKQMDAS